MAATKINVAEKRIAARNAERPHPVCRQVAAVFGTRRNNYADVLCSRIRALYKYADKHCRDGYLTKTEAVKVLAVGAQLRTGHNRLADILTLEDHFALRHDDVLLLKTQFLSAEKREAAIARWHLQKDTEAEKKRRQRSATVTRTVCRRREFGPPDPRTKLFGRPGPMSRTVRKAFKAIFNIKIQAQNSDTELDSMAEAGQAPGPQASVAERQAWIAKVTEAQARQSAPAPAKPRPKKKPLARDEHGVPLCFYRLGFIYFEKLWNRYTEAQWWDGYRKARAGDRLGKNRGGAITCATINIAEGRWQRAAM